METTEATPSVEEKLRKFKKKLLKNKKRLEKKLTALESEYAEYIKHPIYQQYGELLLTLPDKHQRGKESIVCPNYFAPFSQEKISIPLKTPLTIYENAMLYLKKARKGKKGLTIKRKMISDIKSKLEKIKEMLNVLEKASIQFEDIPSIEKNINLIIQKKKQPIKTDKKIKTNNKEKLLSSKICKQFLSTDGYTILVGKNNVSNDMIIKRFLSKGDVWFHTRDYPGSHVIVKNPSCKQLPFSTLKEAAKLAIKFSKAKTSKGIAVIYTDWKHVKKFKKAKPGEVVLTAYKTITIH